jgi:ABC-2 type transport system ATP-binding protein
MISLIDLTKVYKQVHAVDHLNLNVGKGRVFGFLGPNGAGKTTTIKMMAGVLKPTSGKIIINGVDLAEEPSLAKRAVGFIPDRPFVYEKLSGLEFLQFTAALYRMTKGVGLEKQIRDLLELFELGPWQMELVESYSHGMKQRLVMCAALLHRPEVLIVDEPMVGLDPQAARLVKDIFRKEARQGNTVFLSTHSLQVAQEICDEIAIVQHGRLIAQGTPAALQWQADGESDLEAVFLSLTREKTPSNGRS